MGTSGIQGHFSSGLSPGDSCAVQRNSRRDPQSATPGAWEKLSVFQAQDWVSGDTINQMMTFLTYLAL